MKAHCIFLWLLLWFATASSNADSISPIQKVLDLLEKLMESVEEEGKEEAKIYDEFSCFCKDNTKKKSEAIKEGETTTDEESAKITQNAGDLAAKETELGELIKQIESLTTEIADARTLREKEATEAAKVIADLTFACDSLAKAIKAVEDAKPSFVQIKENIHRSLAVVDKLGLSMNQKSQHAITALLQVDQPGEYESATGEILSTLRTISDDFKAKLKEKEDEEAKTQSDHEDLMEQKEESKKTAESEKEDAELAIDDHKKNIADAKAALLDAEKALKDDQLYLKDLTERCELKAKEWDQRTQARAGELAALKKAHEIIQGGAADKEAARALLMQKLQDNNAGPTTQLQDNNAGPTTASYWLQKLQDNNAGPTTASAKVSVISHHSSLDDMEDISDLGIAFLQKRQTEKNPFVSFLENSANTGETVTLEQHKQQALSFLAAEGKRLGSTMLIATAVKLGPDPFAKVKGLIQKLIERLLKQMAEEAGQKGFCDTELGKAKTDRKFQHEKTMKLSVELKQLEVKEEQLKETEETLKKEIADLKASLEDTIKQRKEEKESNMGVIKDSTEGLAAIKEAMAVLKNFYKNAAKNTVLIQMAGPYKGNQDAAEGIMGMLEVIKSDFERSIKETTEAEAEANRVFVEFERESKGSLSSKETALQQTVADLEETTTKMDDAMAGLKDSQALLDDALKSLEELNPQCIDTGMSYAERVAAREAEIKALKKALCQLDPEGVEEDC